MSDKLENFIQNNREAFDSQVPSNQVWNAIQTGLTQAAAGAGAAGAGAGAAGGGAAAPAGFAKIALGWKLAILGAAVGVIGTGIFFATRPASSNSEGNQPEAMASTPKPAEQPDKTAKVEYMYAASGLVKPPIPAANPGYLSFSVPAAQGGKYNAPSGSEIAVPPGTFVDASGNPITGEVELRYREFHDAADVILSGITMRYDEKGTKGDFETAGMIEILGYQDGQPVFIAPGKEINVKMASFVPEDNYNLYFLDPSQGWKDIGKAKLSKNKDKDEAKALLMSKPRPPVKGTEEEMDGELAFTVNYEDFPELRPFKEVRWMAEDQEAYAKVERKFLGRVWTDVRLESIDAEGLRYRMVLIRRKSDSVAVDVKPILSGNDYAKGMEEFNKKMDRFNKMVKQRGIDEKRLANQADVYRTFPVSGFGIYNCDRILRMVPIFRMSPEWVYPENIYVNPEQTLILNICGQNGRGVRMIEPADRHKVAFCPTENNYFVVVLPDEKVGVIRPQRCDEVYRKNQHQTQLEFEVLDQKVQNADDLRIALGI